MLTECWFGTYALCCTWCVEGVQSHARQEKAWENDTGRERARRGCFMRDERGFVWLHNLQRAQASHLLLYDQQASPLLTAAGFNPLIHNLFVLSHLFSSYQAHTSLFVLTSTSLSSTWSFSLFFTVLLPYLMTVFQLFSPYCLLLVISHLSVLLSSVNVTL